MKIVYVIDSLASKGGAERILSEKMNYLTTIYGYDISVITCYQNPSLSPNAYSLSDLVKQIDLNIPYYSQYQYKYPFRLWIKYSLYRKLRNELKRAIQQINPDIIIGLGYFMGDFISSLKCQSAKIIESHEARIFTMSNNGLHRSFISKAYMHFYKRYYLKKIEKNADVVVTLTNGDAQEWKRAKRIEVIPNFTMMRPSINEKNNNKRIISVGRLEWQKGYDRLIDIWKIVSSKHPDWHLTIFGSGTLGNEINSNIRDTELKNIDIHSFTPNISQEYSGSSIFVLPSRFEGFPLVLLEALQHGLPCVAFDCPFGPKDVIENGTCGYVIKNGDIETFANRICQLIDDHNKRVAFSQAAIQRAKDFDVNTIMKKWQTLFVSLIQNRL